MSNPKVFLVDGFADEREMYAEYLALKGFDVRAFHSPQTAVDALRPDAPAALVTRIRQPDSAIDGIALTAIVRAESATRETAIVVITTSMLRSGHDAALRAGCDTCLLLPLAPGDLLNVLRSVLRSRSINAVGTKSQRAVPDGP